MTRDELAAPTQCFRHSAVPGDWENDCERYREDGPDRYRERVNGGKAIAGKTC